MERPFRFIEYKTTQRDEFEVTEGRQPTFALFYLKEGRFRLKIGNTEQMIGAGDCAVFADDVDFIRSVIEPISFVYLKFSPNPKCSFTLPLPTGKIEFCDKARFLADLSRYEALAEARDPRSIYMREHVLEDILLQISAEYSGVHVGGVEDLSLKDCHDPLVIEAVRYIREHLQEKLITREICRALSTNPSTLNFKFRRELSRSVGGLITEERMRTARRLLRNTTFEIGVVAQRCGYENIYYFSTAFRRFHGVSPTAYRKESTGQ